MVVFVKKIDNNLINMFTKLHHFSKFTLKMYTKKYTLKNINCNNFPTKLTGI